MGIYHMYTGSDGQTHLREINLLTNPELGDLYMKAQKAEGIFFREWRPGHKIGFHTAPRRQFVISIAGQIQIGLGDGTFHVFGPGDARLVEDVTGKGHTTAVVGDKPAVTAVVPLPARGAAAGRAAPKRAAAKRSSARKAPARASASRSGRASAKAAPKRAAARKASPKRAAAKRAPARSRAKPAAKRRR
jgi:hypothetical protein